MHLLKVLLLAMLWPAGAAIAQNGYTIHVRVKGCKDGVSAILWDLDKGVGIDSGKIYGGELVLKGHVEGLVTGRIHTSDGKYLVVYVENRLITITGEYSDFQYLRIEGGAVNASWCKSRDWQKGYEQERDSLIHRAIDLPAGDSIQSGRMLKRVAVIDSLVQRYRIAFIKNEVPGIFTMQELYYLRNSLPHDELASMYGRFPAALQASKYGQIVALYLANAKPKEGEPYRDISGADSSGRVWHLSDLKGKLVLLEFWAAWCVPCRRENPALISLYRRYKDRGFEIFGFSADPNAESWKAAMRHDGLPWLNVSDLKGFYSGGVAIYRVTAIPHNFLIDGNGRIVAVNLHGEELASRLKSLLGEGRPE